MPGEEPIPLSAVAADPAAAHRRRGLFFLGWAVAGAGVTMALQMGLNANFLWEQIRISGQQLGFLEAARESCGITAFLLLALMAGLAEPLVGSAMLILVAVGLGAYFRAGSFTQIVLLSLVWSQGLHIWMPLPNSITLALAEPGRAGHRLGQIQASSVLGFGAGLAGAYVLTRLGVPMRPLYLVASAAAVMAAAACLGIPRQIRASRAPLVLRRRYGLYYILCLLEGWRKQISISFATYLLVKVYGAPLTHMLLLSGCVQTVGYFASPAVGKLIDRIGERKILLFYYSCLTVFFVGYATIPNRAVLYALYVVDNAFFVFALALTTYVNRIAPSREHTSTLSMGIAMNHVAAVLMPLVGGLLWSRLGYSWAFLTGVLAAGGSILAALRVGRHTPAAVSPPSR
ncbi:MAG: MFS transporter [Phycisphaerae bacterium]|jgi:predicted MFS family arabinose efflux permease